KWADAAGHPPGAALRAAGFVGVFGYVGTSSLAKNMTRALYADYLANGLDFIGVYENAATDVSGGAPDGVAHARAALADMASMNMPASTPVGPAADEHLSAGQVAQAVACQRGFHDTVKAADADRLVMGYGFS